MEASLVLDLLPSLKQGTMVETSNCYTRLGYCGGICTCTNLVIKLPKEKAESELYLLGIVKSSRLRGLKTLY
jgi:hypothetical protein